MSYDISASKFQCIKVIILQNILDRYKKKILLLDIINVKQNLIIVFKRIFTIIYIIVEDLVFFLIQFITYIYL